MLVRGICEGGDPAVLSNFLAGWGKVMSVFESGFWNGHWETHEQLFCQRLAVARCAVRIVSCWHGVIAALNTIDDDLAFLETPF